MSEREMSIWNQDDIFSQKLAVNKTHNATNTPTKIMI